MSAQDTGEQDIIDNDTEDVDEDIDNSDVDEDEPEDTDTEDDGESDDSDEEDDSEDEDEPEDPKKSGKPDKTEKGTKADKNPLSYANQLRANAEAKVRQYEEFLESPEQVERYLEALKKERGVEKKTPKKEETDEPEMQLKDVNTKEDMRKYLAQQDRKYQKQIEEIRNDWSKSKEQEQSEKVKETVSSRVTAVRQKYEQLRPKNDDGTPNPEFDKDLENRMGDFFMKHDFDKKGNTFKGSMDLSELADLVMFAYEQGSKKGSKRSQTITVEKRKGKPQGGVSNDKGGGEQAGMTPEQKIAARMRAAYARRHR